MKLSIAGRLALYFSLALLAFSLVAGGMFFLLFKKQNVSIHQGKMEEQAQSIADTFSSFTARGSGEGTGRKRQSSEDNDGSGSGMGYGAYLRFLDGIAMADVWVVDSNYNLITPLSGHHGTQEVDTFNYADLPPDAEVVVDKTFGGEVTSSESFSGIMDSPTLTVGAPVRDAGGTVRSVVLLHSPVNSTDGIITDGIKSLMISMGIALAVGVLIAFPVSRGFTRPIKEMQVMAGRLAEGDYEASSHVIRRDEIGDLARSLDRLGEQLRLSSEEEERFQQLQQDFFSNISHELRTPVTVLCGSLEALNSGVVNDPNKVKDYHQEMYDESLALKRLVNDLLDLSRLENTGFRLNMEAVNFCEILSDVKRSAQQLARTKTIRLGLDSDQSVYKMDGDYLRLRQMLMVVLSNAIKFSDENTAIHLRLEGQRLSIRDEGCGIAPGAIDHLFERFYKDQSERNKEGTGLGLPIAKEIADRHGIVLWVESREGEGTTFWFELPEAESLS